MQNATLVRRTLKAGGLSACVLILLVCGISFFYGFIYGGSSWHIFVDRGLFGYTAFHGTPQDVLNLRTLARDTIGWRQYSHEISAMGFSRLPSRESYEITRTSIFDRLIGMGGNKVRNKVILVEYRVPLWCPLLALALPTGFLFWRDRRQRDSSLCAKCCYNLTGNVSGICPELRHADTRRRRRPPSDLKRTILRARDPRAQRSAHAVALLTSGSTISCKSSSLTASRIMACSLATVRPFGLPGPGLQPGRNRPLAPRCDRFANGVSAIRCRLSSWLGQVSGLHFGQVRAARAMRQDAPKIGVFGSAPSGRRVLSGPRMKRPAGRGGSVAWLGADRRRDLRPGVRRTTAVRGPRS
jgi:hypothetical protein